MQEKTDAGEFICLANCKGLWSGTTLSCKVVDMIKIKTDRGSLNTIESKSSNGSITANWEVNAMNLKTQQNEIEFVMRRMAQIEPDKC